jgi:copper chaperone CopZ
MEEKMDTHQAEFRSPEIECDGCARSIKMAIGRMTGVATVTVNVPAKTIAIGYSDPATEEQLVATLDNIGFPIEEVVAVK